MHTFELCDKVEHANGKRTFYGIFVTIFALGLPAVHPFFNVVLGFSRGKGKFESKVVVRSPSNRELSKSSTEFELPDENAVFYHCIEISNLQLFEIGNYKITAYLDRKKVGERSFSVLVRKPPEFTDEQIAELLKKENVAKSGRLELKCPKCKTTYIFQLNLDPKKPIEKPALSFPENNRFRCPNDDFEIDLTGIKATIQGTLGTSRPEKEEGENDD